MVIVNTGAAQVALGPAFGAGSMAAAPILPQLFDRIPDRPGCSRPPPRSDRSSARSAG